MACEESQSQQPPAPPIALECVICFDAIDQSTQLPCACKVSYCMRCWDRALAMSFNASGQARCPTCRSPVRVDFDSTSHRLLFSREVAQEEDEEMDEVPTFDPSRSDMQVTVFEAMQRRDASRQERAWESRTRLIEQARPTQVRLLRSYGEESRGAQEAASSKASADNSVPPSPKCICGCALELVTSQERAHRFALRHFHGAPSSSYFQDRLRIMLERRLSFISCDLCGESVESGTDVWTCENGNQTILHANAYDVCICCFQKHTNPDDIIEPAACSESVSQDEMSISI